MADKPWQYLSIEIGQYGWRGLGGRLRIKFERWALEVRPENYWYAAWTLYVGPAAVKLMRFSGLPEGEPVGMEHAP